jgi:8-oxo-dGTP diphosphatase
MIRGPIVSNRLVLRSPTMDDVPSCVRHLADESVVAFLSHVPFPYTEDDAVAFVQSALGEGPLPVGDAFVIEDRVTGAMIGTIGVRPMDLPDGTRIGEIGYWLARDLWGKGLATEAVSALVPHCFGDGLVRVTAHVNEENAASRKVLEKNGFAPIGLAELWMPARGRSNLSILMALDKGKWHQAGGNEVPILTVVAVALLDGDDRVLLAQRPDGKAMAGLWEFPGGKIEPGEAPETALIRELREELDIDTEESCLAPFCFASHRYDSFHLLMPLYVCRVWKGQPQGREGQQLQWVPVKRLQDMAMPPADVPLVAMLRDYL